MLIYILLSFLFINSLTYSEDIKAFTSSFKQSKILAYIQREQTACSLAQQNVVNLLRSKSIPIGLDPIMINEPIDQNVESRIGISTYENPIECRISLGPAPPGAKCIAPCGCSGSQKWIQFNLYNKLRRKDPNSWKTCQTCKQSYRHEIIHQYSGLASSVIGLVLDNVFILRVLIAIISLFSILLLRLPQFFVQLLASPEFWQMFPTWVKLANLQIVLKIWIAKLIAQYAGEMYLKFEKNVIISSLADIETNLIEENILNKKVN